MPTSFGYLYKNSRLIFIMYLFRNGKSTIRPVRTLEPETHAYKCRLGGGKMPTIHWRVYNGFFKGRFRFGKEFLEEI